MPQPQAQPSPDGIHTWLILWKTARAVEIYAHRSIQALGLGVSDFGVLEVLLHKGPMPVNEIGNKVLLTSSSMTSALDRLEVQGLLERHEDAHDRRTRVVSLTPKGRGLIVKVFKHHARDLEKIMAPLDETERETLAALLRKLGHHAAGLLGNKDRN